MVIGAFLLPMVFVGAPEDAGPEAAAACARECGVILSGVCAKATEETIAKAVHAIAARRTREITPPAKKRPASEINSASSPSYFECRCAYRTAFACVFPSSTVTK